MPEQNNKIALITGGSRGIGAATAVRLAQEGYDICVNFVQNDSAANQVLESLASSNVRVMMYQADVSSEEQVEAMFAEVTRSLGTPSVLVNNAGVLDLQSRLVDMSADRINTIMATNVTGVFLCCREAVKRMSTARGGSGGVIVNVSSAAARLGSAGEYIDYAASKGAVDTLTIGLAAEVAEEGIRVNAVRPGYIYTQMHADGGEPERVDRVKANVPLKRGGEASEVAAAIAWLVSDESSYSTGTFIDVSGGK